MCLLEAAAVGLSALSSASAFAGASQQAADQNALYQSNASASTVALATDYANLGVKSVQERQAASQKKFDTSLDALKARSTAWTAAGEAGVTGLSVDALVGDYFAAEGRQRQAIDTNNQMTQANIRAEMDSAQATAQNRINSVQQARSPSMLPFMISGLSGAVNAFTAMEQRDARR